MFNRRSLMAGGVAAAASSLATSLAGVAHAENKPMLVFVGHEL